ncbi:hypothetical protein [Lacipirellula limnantheis]|uniref:Uncharacterized protein n=1 Tax=Lacipirellula limnantheis TaxID=2528024 RepID=A0A517U560_9BACT|nr:hypothetical protein [Lacipirellula limnantheis]QDT75756.1 hypothetical protein I41_49980 [Lacipirellula limnantheis]
MNKKPVKAEVAQVRKSLLQRLTQAEAAWMLGVTTSWLRDHAELDGRNVDDSYNAAKLVASVRQKFQPAELSDSDLEPSLQLVDEISMCLSFPRTAAELLARISERHGPAGLAAVGERLLVALQEATSFTTGFEDPDEPTAEELREECERRIRDLDQWQARRQGRVALVCRSCRSYRWGRKWLAIESLPADFAMDAVHCPACCAEQEKQERKRKR